MRCDLAWDKTPAPNQSKLDQGQQISPMPGEPALAGWQGRVTVPMLPSASLTASPSLVLGCSPTGVSNALTFGVTCDYAPPGWAATVAADEGGIATASCGPGRAISSILEPVFGVLGTTCNSTLSYEWALLGPWRVLVQQYTASVPRDLRHMRRNHATCYTPCCWLSVSPSHAASYRACAWDSRSALCWR